MTEPEPNPPQPADQGFCAPAPRAGYPPTCDCSGAPDGSLPTCPVHGDEAPAFPDGARLAPVTMTGQLAPGAADTLDELYGEDVQKLLEPVGITEIAQRLGVSRSAVDKWRFRPGKRAEPFPEPCGTVGGAPAWYWGHVQLWHARRNPRQTVRQGVATMPPPAPYDELSVAERERLAAEGAPVPQGGVVVAGPDRREPDGPELYVPLTETGPEWQPQPTPDVGLHMTERGVEAAVMTPDEARDHIEGELARIKGTDDWPEAEGELAPIGCPHERTVKRQGTSGAVITRCRDCGEVVR
jgi:predicted DNA-binding transcriptional regulator AlpA